MAELDRNSVIACLEALGDDNDQAVLAAARDLHTQITGAGADWQDLLRPDSPGEDKTSTANDDTANDDTANDDTAPSVPIDSDDDLAIIDALLGRKNIFEGTRTELEGYKEDIKAGEFTNDDKKYLRSLAARLGS